MANAASLSVTLGAKWTPLYCGGGGSKSAVPSSSDEETTNFFGFLGIVRHWRAFGSFFLPCDVVGAGLLMVEKCFVGDLR